MSLDRALAVLGLIIGLPAFFALFFSSHAVEAILTALLAVVLIVAAVAVNHVASRHPFRLTAVDVDLDLSTSPASARLRKDYRLVANFGQLNQLIHRNIAADGQIHSFTWNGSPVAATGVETSMGEYRVTVPLIPAPTRGKEFGGRLEYALDNSFLSQHESMEYVVDLPTKSASLKIQLCRPCTTAEARVAIGGQEKDVPGLVIAPDRKSMGIQVKRPKVGSSIRIYWTW